MRTSVAVLVVALSILAVVSIGCRRRDGNAIGPAPERARAIEDVGLLREDDGGALPSRVSSLVGRLGERVTIEGTLTKALQAHVVEASPGKLPVFLAVGTSNEWVAYVATKPPCAGALWLSGLVVVRAGFLGGKARAAYAELQLDVDRWGCL